MRRLEMAVRMRGWLQIGAGVAFAIAAEPIHEIGHAVAARLLTGAWPQIGFWSVHRTAPAKSTSAVLGVLAAGDAAVIAWWAVIFLIAQRSKRQRWMLIGPTFMVGLALLNWATASVLAPFGYGHLGASDAVKFLVALEVAPWLLVMSVCFLSVLVLVPSYRLFRSA